jgi:hypothetical protein
MARLLLLTLPLLLPIPASGEFAPWARFTTYNLTPNAGGIHEKRKCSQAGEESEINVDAEGNGYRRWRICNSSTSKNEILYERWLANGKIRLDWEKTGRLEGEYFKGNPRGTWTYTLPTPATGTMPARTEVWSLTLGDQGTGPWMVPMVCSGGVTQKETGELVDGVRDGFWRLTDCEGHRLVSGSFDHGKPVGVWQVWIPRASSYNVPISKICDRVTFQDGQPKNVLSVACADESSLARIEGQIRDSSLLDAHEKNGAKGYATAVVSGQFLLSDSEHVSLVGTWRFYGRAGELIGANELIDGSGDFVVWNSDGIKNAEGPIRDGRAQGVWRVYDSAGNFRQTLTFDKGKMVSIEHYDPKWMSNTRNYSLAPGASPPPPPVRPAEPSPIIPQRTDSTPISRAPKKCDANQVLCACDGDQIGQCCAVGHCACAPGPYPHGTVAYCKL